MRENQSSFRYRNALATFILVLLVASCGMQIPYVSLKKDSLGKPAIIADETTTVPSDVMPMDLGVELFGSDLETDSIDRAEGVTQLSNPAVTSLSTLANQAVSQKDWEKAKSALERALKISPGDASIWRRLAYCYYKTGSYQQALAQAQRASSLSLNNSREQILNGELIGLITKKM